MSIFEYNQELHFRQIAEENQEVGWKKGRLAGEEMATLANLRSLMETLGLTADQALAALQIPDADRERFIKLLQQKS